MIGTPRLQGKVGIIEEAEDAKEVGKFAFNIWFSVIGHDEETELGPWGPYETESDAKSALKKKAQEILKEINNVLRNETGEEIDDNTYLDLRSGLKRTWREH